MVTLGPSKALNYRFDVAVDDRALRNHVSDLLRPLSGESGSARTCCGPIHHCELGGTDFCVDGEVVAPSPAPDRVLSQLFWHLNQKAVETTQDHLLLHAGAVAAGSKAVLLPAPMESGKTTLTAGLVHRGLDYVTDEAVAIAPGSLKLLPYPKPLSVDQGSWDVLAELEPRVDEHLRPLHAFQWQVPPDAIRPGSVAGPCTPAFIVAPRYDPTAPTKLEPIRRSEAIILLAENSFNFRADGRHWLPVLAAVVSGCACYRLSVGDLASACEIVLDLAGVRALTT